jgi:hypothetical protein
VGGFIKTQASPDRPDAQIGLGLYSFHTDAKGAVVLDPYPGMTVIAYYLRPDSQGRTPRGDLASVRRLVEEGPSKRLASEITIAQMLGERPMPPGWNLPRSQRADAEAEAGSMEEGDELGAEEGDGLGSAEGLVEASEEELEAAVDIDEDSF